MKDESIKSEDLREIIERVPDSIARTIIFFITIIILIFSILGFTIEYSDVLSGKAILNSKTSAINIVMPSSGKLELLTSPKCRVKQGQIIGTVVNTAKTEDVQYVNEILNQYDEHIIDSCELIRSLLPQNLKLGEISSYYMAFLTTLQQYIDESKNNTYDLDVKQKKIQLFFLQNNLSNYRQIAQIETEKTKLHKSLHSRDSILMRKGLLSNNDYEQSQILFLQQKEKMQEYQIQYLNTLSSIKALSNDIENTYTQKGKARNVAYYSLMNSLVSLISQTTAWKKTYIITSPINGRLEYLSFLTNGQYIDAYKNIFCVIPDEEVAEVEVMLSAKGMGKIKVGQEAIVKLDDYPYKEYGFLKGIVSDIYFVKTATQEDYLSRIKVKLENGKITNYKIPVELKYSMPANVEVITQKKVLIERLFEQIKYLFEKE